MIQNTSLSDIKSPEMLSGFLNLILPETKPLGSDEAEALFKVSSLLESSDICSVVMGDINFMEDVHMPLKFSSK